MPICSVNRNTPLFFLMVASMANITCRLLHLQIGDSPFQLPNVGLVERLLVPFLLMEWSRPWGPPHQRKRGFHPQGVVLNVPVLPAARLPRHLPISECPLFFSGSFGRWPTFQQIQINHVLNHSMTPQGNCRHKVPGREAGTLRHELLQGNVNVRFQISNFSHRPTGCPARPP